jgi:amino acid adenylation domain-containing protein
LSPLDQKRFAANTTDFRQSIQTLALDNPNAPAVRDAVETLNRGELAMRAGGVAAWVRDHIRNNLESPIVALLAQPSAEQVTGLLGIMSASAAFLPLDPALPPARLKAMIERVGPIGLLYADGCQDLAEVTCREIPKIAIKDVAHATSTLTPMAPNAAAYVMFTSGSTGVPKGILGRYKSLNHFLTWQIQEFNFDATTVTAQLAPVGFDVSLRDILSPLVAGGSVTVPPRETIMSPRDLLSWFNDKQVTSLHCVPSILRLLITELQYNPKLRPVHLRHLFLAGEPLSGTAVKEWRKFAGDSIEVVNFYGPSETTLAKVYSRVGDSASITDGVLPIGIALPNTDVLIHKSDRMAIAGEIGEICIRTDFPSLGYFDDIDATRAAFQRNPFGTTANDVIYKSGDLGRIRPDGQIECLGRRDGQVKIAGNRVETAEIEACLNALVDVTACAVIVDRSDPVDPFLIAYVTGTKQQRDLQSALADTLPDYMIPRLIVTMQSLPRLMNGKLDKRALPRPEALVHGASGPVPCTTPTEQVIESIWQSELGIDVVGAETPFNQLGGDSLKAIKALGEMYRATGVDLKIVEFFSAKTIRAMAKLIDKQAPSTVTSIPRVNRAELIPLSDSQAPLWAMQQIDMTSTVYNLCFGFEAFEGLNLNRLERAFSHIIQSYEILRTGIVEREGEPCQIVVDSPPFTIERRNPPAGIDTAQSLLDAERVRPFDLSAPPLMRVVAAQTSDDGPISLVMSFHHAICDGQSLNTIVSLLEQAYAIDVPLAQPNIQYRDAIAWQASRLSGENGSQLQSYWLDKLRDAPRGIDLPEANARPAQQMFAGATKRHDMPNGLVAELDALAADSDGGLFNTLLTGLAVTLDQRANQPEMVIGTPVLGRNHPDLADQIGFFANTLCLRVSLDRDAPLTTTITQVANMTRDAMDHQDWPFHRLVADIGEPRDLSRNPVCNVMLVLFDADRAELSLPGVEMRPFGRDTEWTFSRFDLVFHVTYDKRDGSLVLDLNYDTALFDDTQIHRIATHFQTILEKMSQDPSKPASALSPFSTDQARLIAALDQTAHACAPTTLTSLFAKQVAAQPEAEAVTNGTTALSYSAMNTWADTIATLLIDRNIGTGDIVAVSDARSLAGVAAILGILKSGACWLAIDERWPAARIAMVLCDSKATLLLAAGQTPEIDALPIVTVPQVNLSAIPVDMATHDALAYVIYTSGSTGKPKGVMINHSAVTNMVQQQIEITNLTPDSNVLQFAAPVFDAHVSELFTTFTSGATLVAPPRDVLENVLALGQAMATHCITHATIPPSYLPVIRDALPQSMQLLITAGEVPDENALAPLASRMTIVNAYGPAENAVCSTMQALDTANFSDGAPIGAPLKGTGLAIWDASGRPVPIGVPGEIVLFGAGLATGYLGAPDLTKRAFTPAAVSGARAYKSGDIAHLRDDGAIIFEGRRDDQIKIAGQRIDLAEVERTLTQATDVARVIVRPIENAEGRKTLGAWVLKEPGRSSLWPSVAEFFVYDDTVYGAMAGDRGRNKRYLEGFRRYLPGKTVLEVGPGPYAILSRLAIEAGAAHVTAVEINPQIADRARATVAEYGLSDNITILTGDAATMEVSTTFDWCISEIVGGIGGSEGAAAIINGARHHLNNPRHMLPHRSVTRIAALELPANDIDPGFSSIAADYVHRIHEQVGHPFDMRLCLRRLDRQRLLTGSDIFEDLDFTHEMALEGQHAITLHALRDGALTGFALWLTLDTGASRNINVLHDTASWLPVYIPLNSTGIALQKGDRITATITRTLATGGRHPDFAIAGAIVRGTENIHSFDVAIPHASNTFGAGPLHDHLFTPDGTPRLIEDNFLDSLRAHANANLPRYAIPGVLKEIETLPLNVNGKLARDELPALQFALATPSHQFNTVAPLAQTIAAVFGKLLGRTDFDPTAGFFEQGGDSISAVRAVGALASEKITLTAADILHHQTAVALAVAARTPHDNIHRRRVGPVHAHPIQSWFANRTPDLSQRLHQSIVLHLPSTYQPELLQPAMQALLNRHTALCLRFDTTNCYITIPNGSAPLPDIGTLNLRDAPIDLADVQRSDMAEQTHQKINPQNGAMLSACLIQEREGDRLLLAAHHLSIDMVSWHILADELQILLTNPDAVLPNATQYSDICDALAMEAKSPVTTTERPYWNAIAIQSAAPNWPEIATPEATTTTTLRRDVAIDFPRGPAAQSHLLKAMAQAAHQVFGWCNCVIDLETHGRDLPRNIPDASSCVGWFTRITPVSVSPNQTTDPINDLLRGGIGHGLLAWASDDGSALRSPAPLALNYLGDLSQSDNFGSGLEIDWDGLGHGVDPQFRSGNGISVLAHGTAEGLFLSLTVDPTIVAFHHAQAFADALHHAICNSSTENAASSTIDMGSLAVQLGLQSDK